MTDLKAIRERAERYAWYYGSRTQPGEIARDVLALLKMIESPDEAAVERACAVFGVHPFFKPRMSDALVAAYTEEDRG